MDKLTANALVSYVEMHGHKARAVRDSESGKFIVECLPYDYLEPFQTFKTAREAREWLGY